MTTQTTELDVLGCTLPQLRAATRRRCIEQRASTSFYPRLNETNYPAAWTYGSGAGDARTSCPYDRRTELAREEAVRQLTEEIQDAADDREDEPADLTRRLAAIRAAADAWRSSEPTEPY